MFSKSRSKSRSIRTHLFSLRFSRIGTMVVFSRSKIEDRHVGRHVACDFRFVKRLPTKNALPWHNKNQPIHVTVVQHSAAVTTTAQPHSIYYYSTRGAVSTAPFICTRNTSTHHPNRTGTVSIADLLMLSFTMLL